MVFLGAPHCSHHFFLHRTHPPWLDRTFPMWALISDPSCSTIHHLRVDPGKLTYGNPGNSHSKSQRLVLFGGWPTPLKNMTSSVGMMNFPIYGTNKNVPNHQPAYIYGKSWVSRSGNPWSVFLAGFPCRCELTGMYILPQLIKSPSYYGPTWPVLLPMSIYIYIPRASKSQNMLVDALCTKQLVYTKIFLYDRRSI